MTNKPIRVGTRGSLLARTQTQWVLDRVQEKHPEAAFELVIIRTSGDVRTHELPARFAGKGFFTKEIEDALLAGTIDLAVHSLKDLPTEWPAGLGLGAIPPREDPRDALAGCTCADIARDPAGVTLGTSSLRRQAQLRRAYPGCRVVNLRGNLDTRLAKTRDGTVDGAVLAAAGIRRLGRAADIADYLPPDVMLPAPGQGALALEIREDDDRIRHILQSVHCEDSHRCVRAERTFMHALAGGCQLPVAALATVDGGTLRLEGRVLSPDGSECLAGTTAGPAANPDAVGKALAEVFLARGAGAMIRAIADELAKGGPQ